MRPRLGVLPLWAAIATACAGCLLIAQPVPTCDLAACYPFECDRSDADECATYCFDDGECADGTVCDSGDCVFPCIESECGGYACDEYDLDECRSSCIDDGDCADGYDCCRSFGDDCEYGECVR